MPALGSFGNFVSNEPFWSADPTIAAVLSVRVSGTGREPASLIRHRIFKDQRIRP